MAKQVGNRFAACTSIPEVLGQLAGAASTCWDNGETPFAAPIFDSAEAGLLVGEAEERINELVSQSISSAFKG